MLPTLNTSIYYIYLKNLKYNKACLGQNNIVHNKCQQSFIFLIQDEIPKFFLCVFNFSDNVDKTIVNNIF